MFGPQGDTFFRSPTEIGGTAQARTSLAMKQTRFQYVMKTTAPEVLLSDGKPDPKGRTLLLVERSRILESSIARWMTLDANQLKGRILFQFTGEDGKDWGGLAKEWFLLIIEALVRAELGLFKFSAGDNLSYQVNAEPTPDQLAFRTILFGENPLAAFSFFGSILAKDIKSVQFTRSLT